MATEPTRAMKVFICYAREDKALRQELEKHLSNLRRQNVITSWYDGDISPGTEWKSQIVEHLNTDQIILLLISADFMYSDFCYSLEMTQALTRHDANQVRVIPIILRPTDWKGAPFAKLKVLPTDGKPVTKWPTHDEALHDEAFEDIVQGIRDVVKDEEERLRRDREEQDRKDEEERLRNERRAKTNRIIIALENPKYDWRTIEGVSEETQLPP